MKKLLTMTALICFIGTVGFAGTVRPIQSNIAKGQYIPKIIVKISDLRNLPVPSTNEDYAFIQSIDDVTNIVIGNFTTGNREIILIQDKNSDGKVDLVVRYYVDKKRYRYSSKPSEEYSDEKFKKLKDNIISGKREDVTPNKEGREYIRVLEQDADRIRRWKNGFRVFMVDPDDDRFSRISFFFSTSNHGADLVFQVKFRHQGVARISPIINYGVYCKNSKDPHLKKVTMDLIAEAKKFMPKEN